MGEQIEVAGGVMTVGDEVVAYERSDADVRRAASCVHGVVLEGGLGFGGTRAALDAAANVTSVETVEINPAVISQVDVEEGDPVVEGDIRAIVADAIVSADLRWDSALLDLPDEILRDAIFTGNLRAAFPHAGQRVVVISDDPTFDLSGFSKALIEPLEAGGFLILFDRFDPEHGIGVRNPHGEVYRPGYGWITAEQIIEASAEAEAAEDTP